MAVVVRVSKLLLLLRVLQCSAKTTSSAFFFSLFDFKRFVEVTYKW
jgi:hypothetical protein